MMRLVFIIELLVTVSLLIKLSNRFQILRWWHDFGITLTLSIFATLAFEAPILGIEKAMFGSGDSKPKPKKPQNGETAKVVSEPVAAVPTAAPVATEVSPSPAEVIPGVIRSDDPSKA